MAPAPKTVIIVAGPTAVGKTSIAIDLALQFNTAIISADSRQCYKELTIGVARPSREELQQVPHYFIASHSVHEEVTAASFEVYALQQVHRLFEQHDVVIMAGGTGLYIKSFCEGLDHVPAVPVSIRNNILLGYETNGLPWLQQQLQEKDPLFFEKGEIKNPQRMMRALEVVEATGKSIIDFRKGKVSERNFNIIRIGLELPREKLYARINTRVDQMMQAGLLEEVKSLIPFKHFNALQTVGYAELFDHLDQKISLEKAVELIKQNSRRYAKRQLTWFKKDPAIDWFSPEQVRELNSFLGLKVQ